MAIIIQPDFSQIKALVEKLEKADKDSRPRIWREMRETVKAFNGNVKRDMPVDTGRAKAGWGEYTPQDLSPTPEVVVAKKKYITRPSKLLGLKQISSEEDVIYKEDEAELSIDTGTHVPYTAELNEGSSRQAPAGFIDFNAEVASYELVKRLQNLYKYLFENYGGA